MQHKPLAILCNGLHEKLGSWHDISFYSFFCFLFVNLTQILLISFITKETHCLFSVYLNLYININIGELELILPLVLLVFNVEQCNWPWKVVLLVWVGFYHLYTLEPPCVKLGTALAAQLSWSHVTCSASLSPSVWDSTRMGRRPAAVARIHIALRFRPLSC